MRGVYMRLLITDLYEPLCLIVATGVSKAGKINNCGFATYLLCYICGIRPVLSRRTVAQHG
jgi:hypothetical protein